jgi:hypothetical protein
VKPSYSAGEITSPAPLSNACRATELTAELPGSFAKLLFRLAKSRSRKKLRQKRRLVMPITSKKGG